MGASISETLAFAAIFAGSIAALDLIAWGFTTVWSFFFGSTL
jgi:hypothetical protein